MRADSGGPAGPRPPEWGGPKADLGAAALLASAVLFALLVVWILSRL